MITNSYTGKLFKPAAIMDLIQDQIPELFVTPVVPHPRFPMAKEALVRVEFIPSESNPEIATRVMISLPDNAPTGIKARLDAIVGGHSHLDLSRNEAIAFDSALAAEQLRVDMGLSPKSFQTFLKR